MRLATRSLRFDEFRLNLSTRELLRIGNDGSSTPVPLGSRAADILLFFTARPCELVTKNEIMDAVWSGTAVEESNLTVQISALRRALDAGRSGTSSIQTIPGRGYRFTLPVADDDEATSNLAVAASGTPAPAFVEPPSETAAVMLEMVSASSPQPAPAAPMLATGGSGWTSKWRLLGAAAALLCAAAVMVDWRGVSTDR